MANYTNFVIDENGKIWYCGLKIWKNTEDYDRCEYINKLTQLNFENKEGTKSPNFIAFKCGSKISAFMDDERKIWVTGKNKFGQLDSDNNVESLEMLTQIGNDSDCYLFDVSKNYCQILIINEYGDVMSCCELQNTNKLKIMNLGHNIKIMLMTTNDEVLFFTDQFGNLWEKDIFFNYEPQLIQKGIFKNIVATEKLLVALNNYGIIYSGFIKSYQNDNHIMHIKNFKMIPINTKMLKNNNMNNLNIKNVVHTKESYPTVFSLIRSNNKSIHALDHEGNLWVYGKNLGQLGINSNCDLDCLIQLDYDTIYVDIQVSDYHTALLDINGNIWSCGQNYYGALGHGNYTDSRIFKICKVENSPFFIEIKCLNSVTIGLDSEGFMYVCGSNNRGQLGLGDNENRNILSLVPLPIKVSSITGEQKKYLNIKST